MMHTITRVLKRNIIVKRKIQKTLTLRKTENGCHTHENLVKIIYLGQLIDKAIAMEMVVESRGNFLKFPPIL
jgi:hypothetical protein